MKKLFIAILAIMALISFTGPSFAADSMLNAKITQAVTKQDKNGNEYTRFIIQEDRSLNGIAYQTDVSVMAFGSTVEKAKTYKTGDQLKAIVGSNLYQGNISYNVKTFIQ